MALTSISRTAWLWIRRELPRRHSDAGILRSVIYMFSANMLGSVTSLAAALLVARWVSPSQMGVWAAARVMVPYVSMLHLGVFSGLNRELPFYLGKNEREKATSYAQASLAWAWRVSTFVLLLSSVVWGWLIQKQQTELSWAILTLGITVALSFFAQHYSATYKSHSEFAQLAKRNTLVALAGLPLMGIVWLFNYWGLLLRYLALQLSSLLILLRTPPFPVKPRWNRKQLWHLIKVGIPIALVGNAVEVLRTLDSIAIAKHSGTEVLGLYIVAIQVSSVGALVPKTFLTVVYPAMSRRYGAINRALPVFWLSCRAAALSLVAGILFAIVGWLAMPQFISLVLPKYVEGTQAAQWSTLMPLAASLTVVESVFNVLKRQDLFFVAAIVSGVIFLVGWILLSHGKAGTDILIAAAQATLLSLQARSIVSLSLAAWLCFKHDMRFNIR